MASNKNIRFGPAFVSNAAANIVNCAITSLAGPVGYTQTQPYLVIKRIRIVNKTGSVATCTLYVGATGGSASGTEVLGGSISVAANSYVEMYCQLRLDSTDFLTGVASAASTLVFQADGEIGIS